MDKSMNQKRRLKIFWGSILTLIGGYLIFLEIAMTIGEGHILEHSPSAFVFIAFFMILGILLCFWGIRLIFRR
jgi:choline-glycine betaine transporter